MRLKPNRTSLTLLLLFPLLLHAQGHLPRTLLWRITPQDGGKPSWLCGTIHVQDRRVFHFTDSLYDALARADAFAMELDPDTLVQAIFAQLNGQKEKSSKKLKDQMDAKTWNEVRPKLKKLSGKDPDQMTVEEAKAYYRKRRQPKAHDDDMPTILDLYLSNIAKDMGKPVTGLEKFADQSSLVDDLDERFDPAKLNGGGGSAFEPAMEKLIRVYADGDLQSVYELTTTFDPVEMDRLLVQRNRKMAGRMDSLASGKSYFFAVGAAHLPGKDGLIEAMRLRGYTVEPVLSDRKMEPDHYVFIHREEWRSYSDPYEGWSISLPGKPFPINTGKGLDMTGYMDLSDMRIYFLMGIAMGEDQDILSRDSGFVNRLRNVYNTGSEMHIDTAYRVIDTDTLRAWDMLGNENASDFQVRIRIVFHGGRMFMVCIGAKHVAEIHDARSEKYLTSFRPLPSIKGFRMFSDTTMGFTVLMPGLTKKDLTQQDSTVSAWHYTCGTTVDGMAANVIVVTTGPNYVITSDSSYFRKSAQNIIDGEMKLVRQSDTVVNGQHAMMLEFLSGNDGFINHMLSVKRGGRIFTLLATEDVAKPSPEARERYFSSLRLLEPGGTGWALHPVPGTDLNVWAPSEWSLRPSEEETPHGAVFLAYDERSSVSYNIYLDTLSRYMWSTDDHALLDHYLASYHFPGQDELSRRYFQTDNGARCIEMTTKVEDSRQVKRVQVCLQGDRLLTATAYVPKEWEHGTEVDGFFNSARPPASDDSLVLGSRGAYLIIGDLHAADADTRDTAYNAIESLYFPKSMFPALLGEVVEKNFPEDSANGRRIEAQLMSVLSDMADSTAPAYIHYFWPRMRKEQEHLRYDLLNMVSRLKTKRAFAEIPLFLKEHLPKEPEPYMTITDLLDTLSLAHGIWKDLLPFSGDSVLGPELFRLHRALLDSGYVTIEEFRRSFPIMQGALASFDRQLASDKYAPFRSSGKAIFNLLGRLNDASSRTWLRKYLGSPNPGGRLYAAVELIKQGQAVDPKLWSAIAKDKETRLDLYDELKALDKLKLFPKEYLSRRSFAESHAWLLAEDDYEPKSIHFLREATTDFDGGPKTFLLYRVTVEDDDGDYSLLVIIGPYKPGTKDLLPPDEEDVSTVYEDDEYAPGLELRHLASYLKGLEKSR